MIRKITLFVLVALTSGDILYSQERSIEYNPSDIESVFNFIGINTYKWHFDTIPQKHDFILYIDEYENDSLINSDYDPINEFYLRGIKQNDLFLILSESNDSIVTIKYEYSFFPVETKATYSLNTKDGLFNWKTFETGIVELNKKVPLILFGTSWKDKNNLSRFCWKYAPKRDLSNKEFFKIEHKVIIGYILKLNKD